MDSMVGISARKDRACGLLHGRPANLFQDSYFKLTNQIETRSTSLFSGMHSDEADYIACNTTHPA